MKRIALATFVLGIVLVLAPVAQAHVMSDDSGGGNAVVLHTDTLGGSGISTSVAIRPDVLGGTGQPNPQTIHTDVLGGDGGASTRQLPTLSVGSDSFVWGETATVALAVAMLLVAGAAVTRRRHRLSF